MQDKTYRLYSDNIDYISDRAIKVPVGDYGRYPERCRIVLPISQIGLRDHGMFTTFTVPGWLREKKNITGYFDIIEN